MKKNRLRPLTLMEVMISFGLFSVILATLFSTFKSATLLSLKGDVGRSRVLERSQLHQRLNQVFFDTDPHSFRLTEDESSKTPILHFSFNNHVDRDPLYSEMIGARLYLDKNDRIILETFPLNDQENIRKEPLLSEVYDFFIQCNSSSISLEINDCPFVFILPRINKEGFLL